MTLIELYRYVRFIEQPIDGAEGKILIIFAFRKELILKIQVYLHMFD